MCIIALPFKLENNHTTATVRNLYSLTDRYSSQTQVGVSIEAAQKKINTTPVGFEPTRGDPIGLAGRRLNRSAKVSAASQC